jgi:hypothetical protein
MEVIMIRTALRHMLSALAAAAVVSAFAVTAVSATERELVDSLQTMFRGTTRDLIAQTPQQKGTMHRQIPWMRAYTEGSDLRK